MTKTKTLGLFIASAALTAAIGLPAWSALHEAGDAAAVAPLASLLGSDDGSRPIILAEDEDEDEDHDDEGGSATRRDNDDDEDSCEDDDGACGAPAAALAPAGSVAPPQNGLFGTAPAQVQVK